jgi:hypothetical protein
MTGTTTSYALTGSTGQEALLLRVDNYSSNLSNLEMAGRSLGGLLAPHPFCPRRPLRSKSQPDRCKVHLTFSFLAVSSLLCSIMGLSDKTEARRTDRLIQTCVRCDALGMVQYGIFTLVKPGHYLYRYPDGKSP